jgi:glycosyltransferase involved in cell wall biosynthesis
MTQPVPVAILTTAPTPYRLALHRRIDAEIPEIRLYSLYSHDAGDQPWALEAGDAGRVVKFARGERADRSPRPWEAPRDWRKGGRMVRWMEESGARALMIGGYNDAARLRLIDWCAKKGVPVFLIGDSNVHGDSARGVKGLVKAKLVKWVIDRCFGIMPCGGFGRDYYLRYGAKAERIYYTPYEPDYGLIEKVTEEMIARVHAELGLDRSRRRMVFCSRMTDFKKPDMAVDAFVAVASRRPEWDLVMIGAGPELERVKARVPEGLRGRVKFTGFVGEQERISALYRGGDVFLHPCVYEPWGVVINESVCAGMALVATATVGAVGELVRDRVNGRTIAPGDLPGMVEAVLDVTNAARLPAYKAASRGVLAEWRRRGDPVAGIRRAMVDCGVVG